jgi:hypothetical protein
MHDMFVILVIVAIIFFAKNRRDRYRFGDPDRFPGNRELFQPGDRFHPGRAMRDNPPQVSAREAEMERELVELRERVKVLERIATDGRSSRSLADEIESLRDR